MNPRVILFLLSCQAPAAAAVVHSGLVNIPIPFSLEGVTLDLDATTPVTAENALGWDVNFFLSGFGIAGSLDFQPVREGTGNEDPVRRFDEGALIVATLPYSTGANGSATHLGAPGNFQEGEPGYMGFRFVKNDDSGPFHGWMRLTLTANGTVTGIVHEWAWETTGAEIVTGQIPEPSAAALVLGGAAISVLLRRKRCPRAGRTRLFSEIS